MFLLCQQQLQYEGSTVAIWGYMVTLCTCASCRWGIAAGTPVLATEVSVARYAELAPVLAVNSAGFLTFTLVCHSSAHMHQNSCRALILDLVYASLVVVWSSCEAVLHQGARFDRFTAY